MDSLQNLKLALASLAEMIPLNSHVDAAFVAVCHTVCSRHLAKVSLLLSLREALTASSYCANVQCDEYEVCLLVGDGSETTCESELCTLFCLYDKWFPSMKGFTLADISPCVYTDSFCPPRLMCIDDNDVAK